MSHSRIMAAAIWSLVIMGAPGGTSSLAAQDGGLSGQQPMQAGQVLRVVAAQQVDEATQGESAVFGEGPFAVQLPIGGPRQHLQRGLPRRAEGGQGLARVR